MDNMIIEHSLLCILEYILKRRHILSYSDLIDAMYYTSEYSFKDCDYEFETIWDICHNAVSAIQYQYGSNLNDISVNEETTQTLLTIVEIRKTQFFKLLREEGRI